MLQDSPSDFSGGLQQQGRPRRPQAGGCGGTLPLRGRISEDRNGSDVPHPLARAGRDLQVEQCPELLVFFRRKVCSDVFRRLHAFPLLFSHYQPSV